MSRNECKKHCFQAARHVITNQNKSSLSQQGVNYMPCLSGYVRTGSLCPLGTIGIIII